MTEAEIETMLVEAGLAPGSRALTAQQLNDRVMAVMERSWPLPLREARPVEYEAWRNELEPARIAAVMANVFNVQLSAYRAAKARLARYRLADGRPLRDVAVWTGEYDPETGAQIVTTETIPAIEPLPLNLERAVFDIEAGVQTGTETYMNPAIAADDAERAQAQAVIDATPPEVVAYHDGLA